MRVMILKRRNLCVTSWGLADVRMSILLESPNRNAQDDILSLEGLLLKHMQIWKRNRMSN